MNSTEYESENTIYESDISELSENTIYENNKIDTEEKEEINEFILKDLKEPEEEVFINKIDNGTVNLNITKKPKKEDYINHIMELKEKGLIDLPKNLNTRNKLQKAKLQQLKELMGEEINKQTNKIINNEKEIIESYSNDNLDQEDNNINISVDIGATALYNMNKILCKIVNGLTNEIKDENNNKYIDLDNLDENLDENKEELLNLYSSIYNEYKEDLTPYISPVNLILYYNLQNGLNTLSSNYYNRSNGEDISN